MIPSELKSPDPTDQETLIESVGWFDRSRRIRLEIAGPDRAKFLHNLTTNDVKRLAEGAGHESFVTSPQGKVLAYVTLLATEAGTILLRSDPDSVQALRPHLDKYGVFDDVTIEEDTSKTFEYHVAGPLAVTRLEALGVELPPDGALRHGPATIAGVLVRAVRESQTGRTGFTLMGPVEASDPVKSALESVLIPRLSEAAFEALRIEAGTPISGRDVTLANLPQEVGRDSRAINFVKGCYLGQETVARLDALGHVNRILKGFRFSGGDVPPIGTTLSLEGKAVGSVTSSALSVGWGVAIGLGYLKVAQAIAGTKLVAIIDPTQEVEVIVHDLPMIPPARS